MGMRTPTPAPRGLTRNIKPRESYESILKRAKMKDANDEPLTPEEMDAIKTEFDSMMQPSIYMDQGNIMSKQPRISDQPNLIDNPAGMMPKYSDFNEATQPNPIKGFKKGLGVDDSFTGKFRNRRKP